VYSVACAAQLVGESRKAARLSLSVVKEEHFSHILQRREW
jgi:hypothetical protein